jgi:hypothetical protein
MDGTHNNYAALFASADFLDNDAGAGGEQKVENLPEYRDIKIVMENLLQLTINMTENGVSKKNILAHKNDLKRLMSVENLSLIESFLIPTEKNDSYNKILQISETLSNEMFNPYSKGVFDLLSIDISGTNTDFVENIGISYEVFSTALDNLNSGYRECLTNLFCADFELRSAINTVENLIKKVNIISNLEVNETTTELLGATAKYIHKTVENIKLYDLFHKFINARKTFISYRNLLQIRTASDTVETDPVCSICMTDPIKQVSVPCGHAFCDKCISRQHACYICRCKIDKKIRLFLN